MIIQNLHDNWKMKKMTETDYLPARVPGSVYNDLLVNKKMDDPYWRDNEDRALALMENDFEYVNAFTPSPELLGSSRAVLRCEGLDTLADLYLNGDFLGKADNMHRTWEYEVKDRLKPGENSLRIVFHSPAQFIREAYQKRRTDGSSDCMDGFPLLRKAHCMFGWDWGPRLPDAGIWRDIRLLGIDTARLDNVFIRQAHGKDRVDLDIAVGIEGVKAGAVEPFTGPGLLNSEEIGAGLSYEAAVTNPRGETAVYPNSPKAITITNPELWWPRGIGAQPLYRVKITLRKGGTVLDTWERRIGLRTMTMHIEKDQYGESFAHEVNGVQFFAMGADYIPEDNIYSRITPERTRKLLDQCAAANFNAIRVWGGGYYPADYFFDICDELGLVVWQDFMFACAVYDLTDDFDQNIRAELADNVKRIRHHPSLGLWCGNNEMEMFVDQGMWVSAPRQKADYIKMYEYIFPQVLKEHDPVTFYWPASPSSGGSFDAPNDPNRGDVHYWEVWHGNKPFSDYRNYFFRYASEFGFQSFPFPKTVETYTLPADRNIFSYIMEKHQRNNAANGKIMNYLYQTFLYPTDFETLIYATQLLQAEAIKYGVEHFRRNRGRCMGAIYWQLNDCWPVASWASLDYYFRWKPLHYFARRFFQPVMISCQEEGILTQDTNVNTQRKDIEKSFRLSAANETREEKNLRAAWEIRDKTAKVLKKGTVPVTVGPLSSVWLDKVEVPELALYDEYLSFHLYDGDTVISEGTVIFSLPKHFHYQDPRLGYRLEGDRIIVTAETYAKSVEILNETEDLVLSDNYFDMNAGEKAVTIISGTPRGIKLRSVYDIR
ncbi:MAG: glycoside hydrolase family 2 protein [Spirochaetaceae bacterium]|jgi:beta-mannosidase|nr:glycoside hydrolase family 2 protein [Spirochaetaceae bacterium]